ncbi:hypothetical protein HDU97_003327, partial [Phlyctochytrium planicorne]
MTIPSVGAEDPGLNFGYIVNMYPSDESFIPNPFEIITCPTQASTISCPCAAPDIATATRLCLISKTCSGFVCGNMKGSGSQTCTLYDTIIKFRSDYNDDTVFMDPPIGFVK